MSARYLTGETAETGDRIIRQGEFGCIVSIGSGLAEYGINPHTHPNYAMIEYEHMGLVCEDIDSEDIKLIEKNTK